MNKDQYIAEWIIPDGDPHTGTQVVNRADYIVHLNEDGTTSLHSA